MSQKVIGYVELSLLYLFLLMYNGGGLMRGVIGRVGVGGKGYNIG